MANTRANNVIYVDTTGYTLDGPVWIEAIKYIGNTSGTALITTGTGGSGSRLWEEAGTNNQSADDVCIYASNGIHVAVTNSAKVYIYLK